MVEAPTPDAPLTDEEMLADAAWMIRTEYERMVQLVLMVVDLMQGQEAGNIHVDSQKLREQVALQVRRSIASANLALLQLEDPEQPVVCENCGTQADLLAENPLDDWRLGLINEAVPCMLCPTCDAANVEVAA